MQRRFVDLSIYLENDVVRSAAARAAHRVSEARDTIPEFLAMLPGVKPEDFPDGEVAAAEWVRLTTQFGTHPMRPGTFIRR